jgi:hypothetical protein
MRDWVSEGLGFEVIGGDRGELQSTKCGEMSDRYRDDGRLLGEMGGIWFMSGMGFDSNLKSLGNGRCSGSVTPLTTFIMTGIPIPMPRMKRPRRMRDWISEGLRFEFMGL